jgi:hypothetical protein
MLDVAARVKVLEERMADHQERFVDIAQALRQFEGRVDGRFASVDARFVQVDQRLAALSAELAALRHDMTTQFRWTASLMFTGFVAIVAAMLSQ